MEAAYFHIRTLLAKWKEAKLFSGLTTTNNTPSALEVVAVHAAALLPQAVVALEVVAAHAAAQPPQAAAALEVVASTAAALPTQLSTEEENVFQFYEELDSPAAELLKMINTWETQHDANTAPPPVPTVFTEPKNSQHN